LGGGGGGGEWVDWIDLVYVVVSGECGNKPVVDIKWREFLD